MRVRISSSVTTVFRRPRAIFFQGHELDEAHGDTLFAREHAKGNDLISSLKPRISTQFTLSGHSPARRAARMPAST